MLQVIYVGRYASNVAMKCSKTLISIEAFANIVTIMKVMSTIICKIAVTRHISINVQIS